MNRLHYLCKATMVPLYTNTAKAFNDNTLAVRLPAFAYRNTIAPLSFPCKTQQLAFGRHPVPANVHFHQKWDFERGRPLHFLLDQRPHRVFLARRDFEHEFIVHL